MKYCHTRSCCKMDEGVESVCCGGGAHRKDAQVKSPRERARAKGGEITKREE